MYQLLHATKLWAINALATTIDFIQESKISINNARFDEQAKFYLNLALLSRQLPWFSHDNHRDKTDMAFISVLFYWPDQIKGCRQWTDLNIPQQAAQGPYVNCSDGGPCYLAEAFGLLMSLLQWWILTGLTNRERVWPRLSCSSFPKGCCVFHRQEPNIMARHSELNMPSNLQKDPFLSWSWPSSSLVTPSSSLT